MPPFLKLLRPGCGLADHDHLTTHTLARPCPAGRERARSSGPPSDPWVQAIVRGHPSPSCPSVRLRERSCRSCLLGCCQCARSTPRDLCRVGPLGRSLVHHLPMTGIPTPQRSLRTSGRPVVLTSPSGRFTLAPLRRENGEWNLVRRHADPAPGGSAATDALKDTVKVGPTTPPRSQP